MVIPSAVEGSRSATLKVDSMGSVDPAVAGLGLTLILIQHGRSQLQGFITLSAKHARNLFAPRLTANLTQLSKGTTASHFFRHHELGCRRRRHRRQMSDAKHLIALRQIADARADGVAISPPTVGSISSKTRKGTPSRRARADLIASINRAISPLDAV